MKTQTLGSLVLPISMELGSSECCLWESVCGGGILRCSSDLYAANYTRLTTQGVYSWVGWCLHPKYQNHNICNTTWFLQQPSVMLITKSLWLLASFPGLHHGSFLACGMKVVKAGWSHEEEARFIDAHLELYCRV